MAELITLDVGGTRYGGWTRAEVVLSLEAISGTFELEVSERWPDDAGSRRPIRPWQECTLRVGGEPVISGHVDAVMPGYDAEAHRVEVWGRDRTADLADCSAVWKTGEWKHRTLDQIARDLANPFGVYVVPHGSMGAAFASVALQEGETVLELLDRLARQRGVLLTTDGVGQLLLGLPAPVRVPVALERGVNIVAASAELTARDRFSQIVVKGQNPGDDDTHGKAAAGPKAEVADGYVPRYRPLVLFSETPGTLQQYRLRAEWERQVRRARGSRVTVTVAGLSYEPGKLWRPNQLVHVFDPWLGLDEPTELLTVQVTYRRDDGGTRGELVLVPPDALKQLPIPEKERKRREKEVLW